MTDFAPILAAYDSAKAAHAPVVQQDHAEAASKGLATMQNFAMPDLKGGFCKSWKADKALITGGMFLLNLFLPQVAVVVKGLMAMGDQLEATVCHLPVE